MEDVQLGDASNATNLHVKHLVSGKYLLLSLQVKAFVSVFPAVDVYSC